MAQTRSQKPTLQSKAVPPLPPQKPLWSNVYQTLKEKFKEFNRELIGLLVYTLLLSLIANLADPSTIACWPHYFIPHETINIQKEPYHIGDVELWIFRHSPPEINPFTQSFHLCRVTSKMKLTMVAVHVDPDITTSPISIFINGQFITYLNYYSPYEIDEPMIIQIDIPKPQDVLRVGDNFIMIISGADYRGLEYGVYNTDDIEFWNLQIER